MNLGLEMKTLVDKGLVTVKKHPTKDLYLYKYKRKVFFDRLWHTDRNLKHARGLVLDGEGNVVVYPMVKIFNLGERGYNPLHTPDYATYSVHKKFNGFMLAATWHEDGWLYTTTGSFDSDFVRMGMEMVEASPFLSQASKDGSTHLFEICHPDDPHIVPEKIGAWPLLTTNTKTLESTPIFRLGTSVILDDYMIRIPLSQTNPWSEHDLVKQIVSDMGLQDTEGVVVWRHKEGKAKPLFKFKTQHYLVKKFLMRVGSGKAEFLFGKNWRQTVDEEYYDVVEYIRENIGKEAWLNMAEQNRRAIIENFFKTQG